MSCLLSLKWNICAPVIITGSLPSALRQVDSHGFRKAWISPMLFLFKISGPSDVSPPRPATRCDPTRRGLRYMTAAGRAAALSVNYDVNGSINRNECYKSSKIHPIAGLPPLGRRYIVSPPLSWGDAMTRRGFFPGVFVTMDICALTKPLCACARPASVHTGPVIINDVRVCHIFKR